MAKRLSCEVSCAEISGGEIFYGKNSRDEILCYLLAFEKCRVRAGLVRAGSGCVIIDGFYVKKKNFGTNPTSLLLYDDLKKM